MQTMKNEIHKTLKENIQAEQKNFKQNNNVFS